MRVLQSKTRLLRATTLAALASTALALPAPAHGARKLEVALQDEAVFLYRNYYNRSLAFQQARELQVSRLRVNVLWTKALPTQYKLRRRPRHLSYNFRPYDDLIDQAARYGIRVHLTLAGPAPAFAEGKHRVGTYKPKARRFAEFAKAAARHFRGRVDRYSIWNEPNHVAWITPVRSQGSIYRKLYVAGRRAIKKGDRRAKVFIGETVPYVRSPRAGTPPLKFLRQVTCANRRYKRRKRCKPLIADGYAHHPYEFTGSPKHPPRKFNRRDDAPLASLGRLTRALNKLRRSRLLYGRHRRRLDLYLHEYGYYNGGRGKVFPPATRARYLVQAFTIAQRNRRVRTMLQYGLVTPPAGFPSGYFDLSIVALNGARLEPFRALRAWTTTNARRRKIKRPPHFIKLPPRRG
jgi:hypothetical protein